MKTNVCGESNGLKLSGLVSVLYTDGGEQTSLEGCTAKVAVIDGLESDQPLEVLVMADRKDLAKPRSQFDIAQDSVRLIVLPPKDLDECLDENVSGFESEDDRGQKSISELFETRVAEYQRAVDSLATSIWHGLVTPKDPLDALDPPVADRIFEDIVPRTMASAQPIEGTWQPFIKQWRPVTKEDYDLLLNQHFNPQETNSKRMHEEEYNDLYKIAVLGTVPDSRSWSQKVSQKVLEYAAVATVVAVLQYGLCSQGFCKSIPGYCSNIQSYLTGNGSTTGDSTAVAPMAHGLYQAQTTEAPGLMQGLVDTLTTAAGGRTGNVAPVSELKETVHLADADIRAAIEADYFPKVIDGVVVKFPRHFGNVATLTEARNDLTTAVENLVMTGKPMETSNLAAAGNFTEADRLAAMVLYQQLLSDNLFKTYLEVTKQDVAAKFAEASIDIAQTAARDARGALMDAVKTVCEKWNMAATDLEAVARGVPTEPSTFVCHKLPTMSFAELNRPGLFVDPGTGWDLQRFRASFSRCVDMDFNPETTDIWLGALGSEWAPRNRTCGRAREGTLMCRGLGVSNPQCFDFEPQWETYPGGLGFLIDMIDRIFRPTGDENCVVRCGGSHALDTPTELWLKNAEERDAVRNAMSGRMDLGDACTRKQLEHFVQVVQKMYTRAITRKYAPEMLAYRAEELKHVWYRAPCGTGIWKPGEPLPTCACPKFSISCETDNHFKVSLTDTNHEEPERTPENVFAAIPPDFKIKRCAYQCLTKIFADANTAA